MGFFTYLYLVEAEATNDEVTITTSVREGDATGPVYFSWAQGSRKGVLHSYADGTIYSNQKLRALEGYPLVRVVGKGPNEDANSFLLEAAFQPISADQPILFHFVLPTRYMPVRDKDPFIQPSKPHSYIHKDRLVVTYPVIGGSTIRYWVRCLPTEETFNDYDLERLFIPAETRRLRFEYELSLGVFKVKAKS